MLQAVRADSPGVRDGKIILRLLGDDDKRYDVALTSQAAADAIVALLRGAAALPPDDSPTIQARPVQARLQVAIGPEMQPTVLLGLGGLTFPIQLTEAQLTSLRDDMSEALHGLTTRQ